jgi:hypothetical protein
VKEGMLFRRGPQERSGVLNRVFGRGKARRKEAEHQKRQEGNGVGDGVRLHGGNKALEGKTP